MKLFKAKPAPVSAEDAAAAERLSRITMRRRLEAVPDIVPEEPVAIEGQRQVFWTPAELSAASLR